ncbi:hypothetical protein TCAL_11513, partial [Tigriopus californicus]
MPSSAFRWIEQEAPSVVVWLDNLRKLEARGSACAFILKDQEGTKSKTYHHAIDHAPVISNQQGKLLDPQVFKGSPKENWSIKTSNELNHLKRGVVTYPERTDSSAVESASSQASANSGETHICQIHNETLDQCLDQEGTYVCKSYGSRCFIIQKMPSSIRTTNGQPIDTQSIQQTLNVAEIKSLVSEATIVVNSNLITWKSKADVCSFARTNATKYPNLDSRNCQECLASSLASSLAKLKASKDQENQTVTSTSNQNIYVQQVRIDKAAASTISSTANETSSFNNPGSRLCTSTTQLYRTQVCSTILSSSSSPSSRSIEPVLLDSSKRGNSNCANNASKYFTALSYKPSSKKKQKFLGRPITPQFEISSKANNNLSSSIGYKSTATYPLKKWPLINSKENGVTSTDDVPGGTTTITVTPPTPLTKESFIVPNGISINGAFTSRTKSLISSVVSTGSKPIDNSGLFSRPGNEFILAQAKKRFQSKIYRSQSLGNLVPNSSKKNPKDLRQQKEPSSKKKQKFLGRPITPQFEISSKANNNLSSSIGYKSTATYPLKKWPLINSKENGVTSTDDVPGGTTTITVTPPTPLTKESFIVPNGISINGAFTSRTKSLISSVVSTGSKPIDNSGLFSRPGNEFILAQAKKRFQSKIYRSQSLGNLVPNSSKKNPKDLRQQKE